MIQEEVVSIGGLSQPRAPLEQRSDKRSGCLASADETTSKVYQLLDRWSSVGNENNCFWTLLNIHFFIQCMI